MQPDYSVSNLKKKKICLYLYVILYFPFPCGFLSCRKRELLWEDRLSLWEKSDLCGDRWWPRWGICSKTGKTPFLPFFFLNYFISNWMICSILWFLTHFNGTIWLCFCVDRQNFRFLGKKMQVHVPHGFCCLFSSWSRDHVPGKRNKAWFTRRIWSWMTLTYLFTVWYERWFITKKQKRYMRHFSTCWSYCLDWLEFSEQVHPRSSLRKYLNGTKLTCQEKTYKMKRTGEAGWQRVNFQNKSQEVVGVFSCIFKKWL